MNAVNVIYTLGGVFLLMMSTAPILFVWWRRRVAWVRYWALADIAIAITAFCGHTLAGAPVWLILVTVVMPFFGAGFLTLAGFEAFLGTRRFTRLAGLIAVTGALATGAAILAGVEPVMPGVIRNLFWSPFNIAIAILIFTSDKRSLRLPLTIAGIIEILGLIPTATLLVAALSASGGIEPAGPSELVALCNLGYLAVYIGVNTVFLWLVLDNDIEAQNRLLAQLSSQAAELREAKAAAEAAASAKAAFLASMSHEIRTPLGGVIGFSDVLLRTELTAQQRDYVTWQQDAGRGLLAVINGILDFSKLEVGEVEIDPVDLDLPAALESCCALFRLAAEERKLALRLELAPDLPRWVRLDGHRLRQVLGNLLGNAVKFTRCGEVVLTVRQHDGRLGFEVRDTGIGIPADKRANLFQPFRQMDGSIARDHGGTGLGLAISRGLVTLLGGRLELASVIGVGSRFFFDLPFVPGSALAAPAEPVAQAAPRALRILVAEDNEVNQTLIKLLLAPDGHSVTMVDNGVAAVEAASRQDLDVVLMDMQMPIMDGIEAARQIRALPGQAGQVPILALTANVMAEELAACRDAGMQGHLTKPVDLKRLRAALADMTAAIAA